MAMAIMMFDDALDPVMALVVSVLTLLVSASPGSAQAQFSPLSILGNILTSVHRARRFQGLGGRFESLLRPHQLRSKFTSDSSLGDSNVISLFITVCMYIRTFYKSNIFRSSPTLSDFHTHSL